MVTSCWPIRATKCVARSRLHFGIAQRANNSIALFVNVMRTSRIPKDFVGSLKIRRVARLTTVRAGMACIRTVMVTGIRDVLEQSIILLTLRSLIIITSACAEDRQRERNSFATLISSSSSLSSIVHQKIRSANISFPLKRDGPV